MVLQQAAEWGVERVWLVGEALVSQRGTGQTKQCSAREEHLLSEMRDEMQLVHADLRSCEGQGQCSPLEAGSKLSESALPSDSGVLPPGQPPLLLAHVLHRPGMHLSLHHALPHNNREYHKCALLASIQMQNAPTKLRPAYMGVASSTRTDERIVG